MIARKQIVETAHTMTIAGKHLHYRAAGAGTPLVLIHGYGVSGHIWQRMLPYLAQQHQVFIVDLPGHGQSALTGSWRLREIAPLLAQWLQQMKLPPVALVGQSMGGAIAIHLTAHAPECVKRLVLVSAAGMPLQAQLPTLAVRSVRSFFQRGNGSYPLALVQDILRPRVRLLWQSAQEMVHSDFRAELATITVPTLIVWGERDVLIPITAGHALSAALPHATFITLPRCGHRPMLAQPATLSRIVLDFLQDE
jgi:pimeloyl-ACP methyl ester carboxylesterase